MQTPRKLRERDCYYVDKTAYIERFLDEGTRYFLSRPRRFGKSLFLDTLKELFEGNESVFEGLHIHDCDDWSVRHLVVRLDSAGGHFGELGSIPRLLREHLVRVAHERRHRRREVQQSLPAGHGPAHRLTHLSLRVQVRGAGAVGLRTRAAAGARLRGQISQHGETIQLIGVEFSRGTYNMNSFELADA